MSTPLRAPLGAIIRNEWQKLYTRKRWTLFMALLALVVGGTLIAWNQELQQIQSNRFQISTIQQNIASVQAQVGQGLTKQQANQEIASMKQSIQSLESTKPASLRADLRSTLQALRTAGPGVETSQLAIQAASYRYELAHHVPNPPQGADSGWQLPGFALSGPVVLLLALIVVYLAGDSVSSERQEGTIPALFLHAGNRRTVFLGKAMVAAGATSLFLVIAAVGWFVVGGLLMGFGSPNLPEAVGLHFITTAGFYPGVSLAPGHVTILPQSLFDLFAVLLTCLSLGAFSVLMVGISTFVRSTSLSTVLGAALVFSYIAAGTLHGSPIALLAPAVHLPLMAEWTGSLAQSTGLADASLGIGIVVLLIWAIGGGLLGADRFDRLEP